MLWEPYAIDSCDLDDCLTFKADGKFTRSQGALLCDLSNPEAFTGTWSLTSDETTMTLTEDAFPVPLAYKVIELTNTKLVIELDFGTAGKSQETFTVK
jgi:hypothetical protein